MAQVKPEHVHRFVVRHAVCRAAIAAELGPLKQMTPTDRMTALEFIEERSDASEAFLELVSDILDELRTKLEPHQHSRSV